MTKPFLCGTVRVKEVDGMLVSARLEDLAEFVPIGSPEHREMVAQKLRILPVETPESKLVGRAERASFWRWLVWALAGFWMAVLTAALWRKL